MGVLNENIATSWKVFVPDFSPYLRLGGKLNQGWLFLPNQCNPIQESWAWESIKGVIPHLNPLVQSLIAYS